MEIDPPQMSDGEYIKWLENAVDKLLAIVRYPADGDLRCCYYGNNIINHTEGCWYMKQCAVIDAAREAAKPGGYDGS